MFLATTAITEFWDKNDQLVFLGEWCKSYDHPEEWMNSNNLDIPFLWNNQDSVESAIIYCKNIYEKALPRIAEILNSYHGIRKNDDYYRIILGNWLISYCHILFDRYATLKKAFELYPELRTYILDPSCWVIPTDHNDFIAKIVGDEYNLQLYSQILLAQDYKFPMKKLSSPLDQQLFFRSTRSNIANILFRMLSLPSKFLSKDKITTITNPYFKYNRLRNYLGLALKSHGGLAFDNMDYAVSVSYKINRPLREKMKLGLAGDKFENILSRLVFLDLPALFLEGFKEFRNQVDKLPIRKTKTYFCVNSVHSNYIFKFHLAENRQNLRLLIQQHGGGFGIDSIYVLENYERSIADIYFTWGWKEDEKTRPLSFPISSPDIEARPNDNDSVLYSMTCMPRYMYRFQNSYNSSLMVQKYLPFAKRFLNKVDKDIQISIRSYPSDYGWSIKKRLLDFGTPFTLEGHKKNFLERLKYCRIFVVDHLHTTYLESLSLNKPTIIFADLSLYPFRSKAKSYFEELQKVKILHSSPESAAEHLNATYRDIDRWWGQPDIQEARRNFCNVFARMTDHWTDDWVKELLS
jgi:putative transferase (TIGR04331 family)